MSRPVWLGVLLHVVALAPLALLLWDFSQDRLTAEPMREIQLRTGRYALSFLVLSLACTPAGRLLRLQWALTLRRPLGLYAFGYASLHLLNFIGLDYGFDFALLWLDVADKRFIFAGLASWLMLLPLALTSTAAWQKRLGAGWLRLHRLVYLAAIVGVVHFFWLTKGDFRPPLVYAAIIAALLMLRVPCYCSLPPRRT